MSPTEPRPLGGYLLLRRLGTGGAGTVWEAEDEGGTRVALKMLHPALAETEEGRTRLLREARLVNQIPGRGVARVLDVESEDTTPFVVTELIEGPTLAQVVAEAPLSAGECLNLAVQLEDILYRMHQAGIVHRDLKPSNIIIGDDGPALIDFGIAQGLGDERITQTGKVTGTPGYVSPELLRDDRGATFKQWCDGDWWAWSALLLSSMTGAPPFGTGSLEVVVPRVFSGYAELGRLGEPLRSVFAGALAADPAGRLDPWEVIEALKETVSGPHPNRDSAAETTQLAAAGTDATMQWEPPVDPGPTMIQAPTPALVLPAVPDYVGNGNAYPYGYGGAPWAPPSNSAAFAPPPYSYVSPGIPRFSIGIIMVTLALSVLAGWAGGPGLIVALLALACFATWGQAYNWRETRRSSYGEVRNNDSLLATLGIPWHLLTGLLHLIPGILAGAIVLLGGWFIAGNLLPSSEPWLEGLQNWGMGDVTAGLDFPFTWLIAAMGLLVTVATGTSAPARQGIRLGVNLALPSSAARTIAYIVMAAGIGLAAFLLM